MGRGMHVSQQSARACAARCAAGAVVSVVDVPQSRSRRQKAFVNLFLASCSRNPTRHSLASVRQNRARSVVQCVIVLLVNVFI